jgi:hypothetical protein
MRSVPIDTLLANAKSMMLGLRLKGQSDAIGLSTLVISIRNTQMLLLMAEPQEPVRVTSQ